VFTGSRQSELESCGCHQYQSGGVDREAQLYENLRKTYPNLVAMDAGGWIRPMLAPHDRLKTDYLVKAMCNMRFEVFNITPFELAFGTTYPTQLVQGKSGRLISANLLVVTRGEQGTSTAPRRLFAPYAILEIPRKDGGRPVRVGVIGLTDPITMDEETLQRMELLGPQMPQYQLLDMAQALKTYVPEVRKQADYVIVLALMNRYAVAQFPGIQGIDLFVTAYSVQSLQKVTAIAGRTVINTGYMGRSYSQALITFDGENRPLGLSGGLVGIAADAPVSPSMTKLLDQYHKDTVNLVRRMAVAQEKSRFAGRTQCITCHNREYLHWTRTRHNFAYASLTIKNQHYNPDCLPCHVTGYQEVDGFVDVMQTGHLVSVQCEVCHGPARAHVKALTEMTRPDASGQVKTVTSADSYPHLTTATTALLCLKCHNADHDPKFNYERDFPLISHKNFDGPFRRPETSSQAPPTTSPLAVAPLPSLAPVSRPTMR
jgi:cytochrome c553